MINIKTIYENQLAKHHRLLDRLYKIDVHLINHPNDIQSQKSSKKIESIFKKNLKQLRKTKQSLVLQNHKQ